MRIFKSFFNLTEEEKWLETMTLQGYLLIDTNWGYNFKKVIPFQSTIRIDVRTFKNPTDFTDYCNLFLDSGWKHIAGNYYVGAQYFIKFKDTVSNEIFSDNQSKALRYLTIANSWLYTILSSIVFLFIFPGPTLINLNAMLNPKTLYLTPDLWERTGLSFWKSFLFETPFAFARGYLWLFIPLLITISIFYYVKYCILYKSEK